MPVESLRRAVALAVKANSLRAVARQVGMSAMGLRHFIDGRNPYSATLRKLTAWHVKHAALLESFSPATARSALDVLLEAMPESERDSAALGLLHRLDAIHREKGVPPPGWLAAVMDDLRGE